MVDLVDWKAAYTILQLVQLPQSQFEENLH